MKKYRKLISIFNGKNTQVYRAQQVEDGMSVILKILKADYPTLEQLRRYKQEYKLTHQLNLEHVIKSYRFEKWQRKPVIVFEDIGGISLQNYLQQFPQGLPLELFFPIAIEIVKGLNELYGQKIIHKDINPSNIIFNPKTTELKIIDLGISSQLSQENPLLESPQALEGTLHYISPEQTGRMNRILDYRTDFYSLGVTCYELLTGKLPFTSDVPIELIHAHIAKEPISLSIITNNDIPKIVAEIVSKLMAKNAEDRYQSGWGLKSDLETCLLKWQQTRNIPRFILGQNDSIDQLQVAQKLYGREKEISALLAAFERVYAQEQKFDNKDTFASELILVTGYSGIGKSALVRSLYKPITEKKGYFISGKYDQFQGNIPYFAIVNAFAGLVKQLLGESEEVLSQWRDKLLKALANKAQVIVDVIPDLELIIGPQSSVPELGTIETQNRFNLVFQSFVQVFCDVTHPLVLFLDDLQWADLATLKLLEQLLGKRKIKYLLIILAYRNNEVTSTHPLSLTIQKLEEKGISPEKITLTPLSSSHVAELIAETIEEEVTTVIDLAELVTSKTQGNPFFTKQFLKTLYQEKLLTFDHNLRKWQWELEQIDQMAFTDNMVQLMERRLQKLPTSLQNILSTAAYLGTEFDLETLCLIENKTSSSIFSELKVAMEQRFILPKSALDENLLIQNYQFRHDRIQQAAYRLIPEEKKAYKHYHIGKILLEKRPKEAIIEKQIFELVNQLNYGTALISEQKEREELAQLNLIACRKAKSSTAYQAGRNYANIGISLLGERAWQEQYQLNLQLHDLAAELAYLCGDREGMERISKIIISQSKCALDRVNIYQLQIFSQVTQSQFEGAIDLARDLLQNFGICLPKNPLPSDIEREIREIDQLMENRDIEDLMNLPIMTDKEKIAIIGVYVNLSGATFLSGSSLFPLIAALSVKLSIQYGNTQASSNAYALYADIACTVLNDIKTGVRYGQLALEVVSKLNAKTFKPHVYLGVPAGSLHRQFHIRETLPILEEGYYAAIEVGSFEYVGFIANIICLAYFCCNKSLWSLEKKAHHYCGVLEQFNQPISANYCRIHWQMSLNLQGLTENPMVLSGEAFAEEQLLPKMLATNDMLGLCQVYLYKIILYYLFGDMESALDITLRAQSSCNAILSLVNKPAFYFYESLVALAVLSSQSEPSMELWKTVEENQKQLQEQWATYAPMNHQHKVDLVEAEKYRVLGDKAQAIELYDQAIAGAKNHQYIQEEALAHELAAKFYLDWGKEAIARSYMLEARYCYLHWGAEAKVKQLEEKYPQLLQSQEKKSSQINATRTIPGNSSHSKALDLTAFTKASNAISSEIKLEKLLQTLMQILLENAGAQSGYLLLPNQEGLPLNFSVAIYIDNEEISLSPSQNISQILPQSIFNYVVRTHKTVFIDQTSSSDSLNFANDPYIQSFKPSSILCFPLINQGKLVAIVYLENKVTKGLFTKERIEFLQLLSGQAAIAISNARLYASIDQQEKQLRQFLEAMPVALAVVDKNGRPYYTNQLAVEILQKPAIESIQMEQLSNVYNTYITETNELCPHDQLPVIRALRGEKCTVNNLEIRNGIHHIPIDAWASPIYNDQDNIEYAIVAFQDTTQRKKAEKIIAEYNQTLTKQVAERTEELSKTIEQLKATQSQLILSEKMATLGQLIEGIGHEINTPLAAIQASISNTKKAIDVTLKKLPLLLEKLSNLEQKEFFSLIKTAPNNQKQLSSKEKRQYKRNLAKQLELNNIDSPRQVADILIDIGIYDYSEAFFKVLQHPERDWLLDLAYNLTSLQSNNKTMITAIERVSKTIFALKSYGRYNYDSSKQKSLITKGIDLALELYKNVTKKGIEVERNYHISNEILCYPDELIQVWTNLINNSIQAMEGKGKLIIDAQEDNQEIIVKITDSGCGIPTEIKEKIFEPFFSTKSSGEGSGLGLDIVKKIIDKHQGKIVLESEPNNTCFIVTIPKNTD